MNLSDKINNTEITMTVGELQEANFDAAKESVRVFLTKLQKNLREHPETPCTFGDFADLIDVSLTDTAGMTFENWTDYL